MKRIILAVPLATYAATSFTATFPNDQFPNTAGEADQHQPQEGN